MSPETSCAMDFNQSQFRRPALCSLRRKEVSTGSDSDRVGTHASGVLESTLIASRIARRRRAYHPVAIAPGTDSSAQITSPVLATT